MKIPMLYNESAAESWIQCQEFLGWAHTGCAGVGQIEDYFVVNDVSVQNLTYSVLLQCKTV